MDELFAPPEHDWKRLSPKFRSLQRLTSALSLAIVFTVAAVVVGLASELWWISGLIWLIGLVIIVARWIVIGRAYRAWGYVERDEDLYITRGVLFRSLITVPYGRMQLVDVHSGPLERAYGLATVQLITASASTDAVIPGLAPDEATRLRDRLTSLGEARSSGL